MIRLASIRDIRRINELLLQVQKVHSDIRPDLFKYIGTKYNDSELEGIIKNSETPVFVYESDNKVVGYVFCIVTNYHNDTSFCDHKTIYIDDLCVDENARHEGIGTALYEYVLEYAKSDKFNSLVDQWKKDSKIAIDDNMMKQFSVKND